MNLSKNVKMTLVIAPLADGQTNAAGTVLDMAGYDGVVFVNTAGVITGSGTCTLQVYDSANNSSFGAITAATAVLTAAAQSNCCVNIDLYKPLKRYLRINCVRATANSIWAGTVAIQYGAKKAPTTHDATTFPATSVLDVASTS